MCTLRLSAISLSAFQNSSSRLTLVFLPLKTIERLAIDDFGMGAHRGRFFGASFASLTPAPPSRTSPGSRKTTPARSIVVGFMGMIGHMVARACEEDAAS